MIRPLPFLAAHLLLLVAPAAASAQFDFGARLGIGFAGGEYGTLLNSLTNDLDQALAVGGSVGYRIADGVSVGGFLNYLRPRYDSNIGRPITVSLAGSTYALEASAGDLQLGARGELLLGETQVAGRGVRPWGAIFAGWERLWFSYDATRTAGTGAASLSPKRSFSGWMGGVEAGLEVGVAQGVTVGPFFSFELGKFGSFEGDGTGVTTTGTAATTNTWQDASFDIASGNRALHYWTAVGLRGRYSL